MQIVELRVSNFARLRAVEIRPGGAIVPITGANSAGKTSVLRSIWTALEGRAAAPPRPIHEGAEEAIIKLDLGSLKITRKFRRDAAGEITTDLSVVDDNGGKIRRSPQAVLDAMLADLSFDPLAFSKMKPSDQYLRLRALVPGVDFDALAAERQKHYDNRTIANRDAKEAAIIEDKIALPNGPEPKAVDVAAMVALLSVQNAKNANRARSESIIKQAKARLDRMVEELLEAQSKTERLKAFIAKEKEDIGEMADNLSELIDTQPLQDTIASAQRIDTTRKLFASKRELNDRVTEATDRAEKLTKAIAAIDQRAVDAIASAKLPGELTLDANEKIVMLRGLPFSAAGTADKIIASAKVAMALSPELRVMLIDEGSELDRAHMEALGAIAAENDYQVWIARVEEGEGGIGFRIEDGMVSGSVTASGKPKISPEIIDRSKEKNR